MVMFCKVSIKNISLEVFVMFAPSKPLAIYKTWEGHLASLKQ